MNTARLPLDETVRLDPDKLGTLYYQLGEAGAETVVCRAMEELAIRLHDLPRLLAEGDIDRLGKVARSLVGIAEQIGMMTLARVALDVSRCAGRGDDPALGATLARLQRIGDRSLTAIWDMQDMTV
ncbi:hypothetical protein [Actibacterium sp. 188UL27-1]|uniref:hypothetical protein n=1 Tax=Actibacterium sp. 188UL27-1 TaxID=2786961 RepID=UPI00195C526C|nr:hypothetical protein [Actibacterium sp. 188UL27-1]MBM7067149.1 hypothetical protein [Actibacterium sp. 188UL27-1]